MTTVHLGLLYVRPLTSRDSGHPSRPLSLVRGEGDLDPGIEYGPQERSRLLAQAQRGNVTVSSQINQPRICSI
jgi:hypothetical protein